MTKAEPENYLDDFLFMDFSFDRTEFQMNSFANLCDALSLPFAPDKTEGPTKILKFLGLLLDALYKRIGIPAAKVNKAQKLIQKALKNRSLLVSECRSLAGFLNFLSRAVTPGRTFIRGLYSAFALVIRRRKSHMSFRADVLQDLRLWNTFLTDVSVWRPFVTCQPVTTGIQTDAAGSPSLGVGGFHKGSWFARAWPAALWSGTPPSIAFLELMGIAIAFFLWAR